MWSYRQLLFLNSFIALSRKPSETKEMDMKSRLHHSNLLNKTLQVEVLSAQSSVLIMQICFFYQIYSNI